MLRISQKLIRHTITFQKNNSLKIFYKYYSAVEVVQCAQETIKKGLLLGIYINDNGDPIPTPACCKFNEKMQGKLMDIILRSGKWERWKCRAFNNIEDEYWSIAVVCLGKKDQGYNNLEAIDESRDSVRGAAGCGARFLYSQGATHIYVEGLGRAEQAAEGAALSVWRYQEFKNKKYRRMAPTLELYDEPDHEGWQKGLYQAEAQNLCRRFSEAPANHMTPTSFSHEVISALCPCGIKVDIHDKDWIENNKLNAILHVAKGSCEPPVCLELHYCGGPPEEKPILFVGKSTTFDAGGLCLKDCKGMSRYRADISGGATIVGVMRACAMLSLPLNVSAIIALCENLPSGMAMKVGDVIKFANGCHVEIKRTDQEGHLILADCLLYGIKTHKPRLVIDLSTMTRGVKSLLGSSSVGTFSNSEYMWKQIRKAGIITGDRCWRLPIWKYFKNRVTSHPRVDLNNRGRGPATPCLGAAYLSYFVDCVDWIHMDTTGVGMLAQNIIYPHITKSLMMGRPTRTLIQLLYQLACPNECDKPY